MNREEKNSRARTCAREKKKERDKTNKYNEGKIYKLINKNTNELLYIGSTTLTLNLRMNAHRYDIKNEISGTCAKMNELHGYENIIIELIEDFNCETKKELYDREAYYIKLNMDIILNTTIPSASGLPYNYLQYYQNVKDKPEYKEKIRKYVEKKKNDGSAKQYYLDNKDKAKEYQEKNKEHIKIRATEYRLKQDKEKQKEYREKYREDNKNIISEKCKQKYQDNKEKSKQYYLSNKESSII